MLCTCSNHLQKRAIHTDEYGNEKEENQGKTVNMKEISHFYFTFTSAFIRCKLTLRAVDGVVAIVTAI